MSREAMEAVQDHSKIDDPVGLCVLMAIARFVPPDGGECWPSVRTLAEVAHCNKNTVMRWVGLLEEAGEIVTKTTGRGRGRRTKYRLTLPMNEPKHGAAGVSDRDNSETIVPPQAKTIPLRQYEELLSQHGELLSQQNELLSYLRDLLSQQSDLLSQPRARTETRETIRETRETKDIAPPTAAPAAKRKPKRTKSQPEPPTDESDHQRLMRLYQDALGYKIPNGGKEGRAAKQILSQYTPDDAIGCYRWLKADTFWQAKHLSLQSVFEQLGPWVANGRPTSRASKNGSTPKVKGREGRKVQVL